MIEDIKVLSAIPSTEPATFREFVNALEDKPERGDKKAWWELFQSIERLEKEGLIEVERANKEGSIETMLLSEAGIARVRSEK